MWDILFVVFMWPEIKPSMMWDGLAPGTWLIFGIILFPVYTALIAWFVGFPRDPKKALMGVGYLVGLTVALWLPAYIGTVLIELAFF